jgi:hypothetical protein
MVDSRLHRALHFGAQRRDDLVVPDGNRPLTFGQPQLSRHCFMMRTDRQRPPTGGRSIHDGTGSSFGLAMMRTMPSHH